jgi:hypothetical protein
MYARAVDDAARQLHDWQFEERAGFVLGPLVLALSVAATRLGPAYALPLFFGGLYLMARVAVAAIRRSTLLDRLAEERDAYTIPEVATRARRTAAPASRAAMAASIRSTLQAWSDAVPDLRVARCCSELAALAALLERDDLELEPTSAVACRHLVDDATTIAVLAPGSDTSDLACRARHVRAGFTPRDVS